ncbi:Mitochondrial intermediate peptidase [Marasmius crinis-equi]|uniref:mitochondrial intermediate peptidase n=1 Tax=Marasmius crinis-equi TaxID=585013 RepID=A0ABR3FVD7_9AGAR
MLSKAARNALKSSSKQIFRFQGCLHENARIPIHHSLPRPTRVPSRTAATLARPIIPASPEDKTLVALFDQPTGALSLTNFNHTGLFGHPSLTHPRALISLANATLFRAQALTDRILRAAQSRDELFKVVKNLDRLSDLLCGVIDLSELVRNSHPDRQWVDAANHAYEMLCEFMNVLNTHVGLYEVLKIVFTDPEILKSLTPEAYQTALIFWKDFEKSAINLPPETREQFVRLSSEIIVLGRHFLREAATPRAPVAIKPSDLAGLKDQGMGVRLQLQARFTQRDLLVYPGSLQAQMIMRSAPQEEPRRKVYIGSYSSTEEQIEILETLLRKRAELARLVGAESFAHLSLDDKMAKSPENVQTFLNALMDHTRPAALSALNALSLRKQAHLNLPSQPVIQAWDRDFYCPPEPPSPPIPLPPLTVGTVFMGLSRLFKHLYGISLRPVHPQAGEVWHSNVHKLEVVDEEKGVIGWIYADLFARRGKASGAAHYTVRCSRRTDDDDEMNDGPLGEEVRESLEFEAMRRHRVPGQEGVYQLPLVVLLCEFARPSASRGATVLEWHEVNTLFHEMGHAMHSMIGRTDYQNVSGTRCATDFVELPSILMEHFLNSPTVLSLFSPTSTGTPQHQAGNHHVDPCHSIDTFQQFLLAALDQLYHSSLPLSPDFDSSAIHAQLTNTQGLIPYVEGTSYQTQFSHLFGYGATYYSYLLGRAIASRVWGNVFRDDPLEREVGERYKREVLRFGGGRDPWKMVARLLGLPELENGDKEAIGVVGRWRLEDEVGMPGRH